MKKMFLLTAALLVAVSCQKQEAERGMTGTLSWELTKSGVLTISGKGAMPDYNGLIGAPDYNPAPWDPPRWPWVDESFVRRVIISEGVTSIGNYAIHGRPKLAEVAIPASVSRIGNNAFSGCSNIRNIIIPKSVTSIGSEAFRGCYSLATLTIPQGVKQIGKYAFRDCESITEITIPTGMESIEDGAFHGCRKVTTLTIPDNILTIGDGAFCGSNLTSIIIGRGVTSIGVCAFTAQHDARVASVTIHAMTPPALGDELNGSFTESDQTVLYVPKGCVEAYKASPAWSREFKNIVEQQ